MTTRHEIEAKRGGRRWRGTGPVVFLRWRRRGPDRWMRVLQTGVQLMKCAVEEGAEETFSLTRFITRRPSSSSSKLLMSSLSVWVVLTAEEEEAPGTKAGVFFKKCVTKVVWEQARMYMQGCRVTEAWDFYLRWKKKKKRLTPRGDCRFFKKEANRKNGRRMNR